VKPTTQIADYLVIGQGLAGTLLAHFLIKKGQRVIVADHFHTGAASKIAAGLINPVTGKRQVKSWRIVELLPEAAATFAELENLLNIKINHPRRLIRVLKNAGEENTWLARSADPSYQSYFLENADASEFEGSTHDFFAFGELQKCSQNDLATLLAAYRGYLESRGILLSEKIDYQSFTFENELVFYKNFQFKNVVFCEGAAAVHNPFFNYLPFQISKGEALIIEIPDAGFSKIFKHGIAIVPLENNRYWVGSTNSWDLPDDLPSENAKKELLQSLHEILKIPFKVVEHKAAFRPTVLDRRPLLGRHPEFSNLFIFNGLGTKGASLGPLFAKKMAAFLIENKPLDAEVDVGRFKRSMRVDEGV